MTDIENIYRKTVVDMYNRIALTGLPERTPHLHNIPLDKIFVKLTITVESSAGFISSRRLEEAEWAEWERAEKSEPLPFLRLQRDTEQKRASQPITIATALHQHPRFIITGAPGSGKTTLLRWLAVIFAQQRQAEASRLGADFTENTVPILLELRRFSKRFQKLAEKPAVFDLAQEISAFVGDDPRFDGVSESWMRETLVQQPCLLLLDGLDEIADSGTRQRLLEALEAFVQKPIYANVRCILTTRPHGFRDIQVGAKFQRTEVRPFTSDEVAQFIQHWYDTAYQDQAEAQELIAAIQAKSQVTELAQNPLLCTIIAIIYRNNRVLPNRRVELYLKCCEALLDTWERNKQIKESGLIGKFDWQTKLELLMPVAYWFHQQSEQLAMPEAEVVKQLANALTEYTLEISKPILQEAREFIEAIRDRSGLLQGRGDGTLEFTHRTFQEYLAARHIANQIDPVYIDMVMAHLHEAWWREVHLLVIGHFGSGRENAPKAERLLLTILRVYRAPSRWLLPPNVWWWLRWFNVSAFWQESLLDKSRQAFVARFLLTLSLLFNLGIWFPRLQWRQRIAWHLMREFELVAQGYADCAMVAKTQKLSTILADFTIQRISKWIYNPLYQEQLDFLIKTLAPYTFSWKTKLATELLKALPNKRAFVRHIAVKSLGNLKQTNSAVIEALTKALRDEDEDVRSAVANSLGELGITDSSVIEALKKVLLDKDWSVRSNAARSLGQLGIIDSSVINALKKWLLDKDWSVRSNAARSLGELGTTDSSVIEALKEALLDKNEDVRSAAASSLGKLETTDSSVIEILTKALQDENWRVRSEVASSLGKLGTSNSSVIEALKKALQDEHGIVQIAAAYSLGKLGTIDSSVIEALTKAALQDEHWIVRDTAADSLGKLGATDSSVIYVLKKALLDEHWMVRGDAASSLGNLGITDSSVIYALKQALQDKDEYVRRAAASSLGELGTTDSSVIEALKKVLRDKDQDVRHAAAESLLGKLKLKDETILQQVLIQLNHDLHDSDIFVRRQAFKFLCKRLEGQAIPGYRWKPLAKNRKGWWKQLGEIAHKIYTHPLVELLAVVAILFAFYQLLEFIL